MRWPAVEDPYAIEQNGRRQAADGTRIDVSVGHHDDECRTPCTGHLGVRVPESTTPPTRVVGSTTVQVTDFEDTGVNLAVFVPEIIDDDGDWSSHDDTYIRLAVRAIVKELMDRLNVGPAALFSTLGRVAARGMETVLLARRLQQDYDKLVERIKAGDTQTFTKDKWEPESWPAKTQGYGFLDAPRGALGHWVQIENGKIARYREAWLDPE